VTLAGAEATGVYAACMSVVAFANPFLRGLGNTLLPRAVVAWRQRGTRGLWRRSVTDALLLGVPMALFCVAVAAVGDDVVRWLYRSQEFAGHGVTMTVLTLAVLAATLGIPATNALASIERPRANVAIGAGAALVTLFAVWSLEVRWGLLGIACGALTGNVVGSIARWAALWHALRVADHDRSARLPSPAQ
jgi:O-antigen/teichoic acid export membrane protein